jgi:hypothetical protein
VVLEMSVGYPNLRPPKNVEPKKITKMQTYKKMKTLSKI